VSRVYRLVVDGELSDRTAQAFDGMSLTRETGTTVLLGPVSDQAQLQRLFERLADLGLTLVSANALDEEQEARPRAASKQ
jgi:hypothetical protein